MASLWFLKLALKCLDLLAWPLLALGYPLCSSVQAIETDSYKGTRDLISYWILLSLIHLFEYAFSRLLQWFQFWPYIKLMIIFWLIIPDFGRASNAYNNLIRPCISLNPQAVICRLNNWRKIFVKKDNFLLHAERYVKDNGTQDLEKLIASKSTTYKPDAEATNAIRATDNKEMQQDIPVAPNLVPSQNASLAMVETKGIVGKDTAGVELPQSSTHKEVQKEWTCALCHVTTSSETILNSHLHGKKHRAKCETLKAKNQPVPQKLKSKEELKQSSIINQALEKPIASKNTTYKPDAEATNAIRATDNKEMQQTNEKKLQTEITDLEVIEKKEIPAGKQDIPVAPNLVPSQNASLAMVETKGIVGKDTAGVELPQSSTHKEVQKEWTCALCHVTTSSETILNSHLHGKKHRAKCETLKAKNQPVPQKLKSKEELKQSSIINQALEKPIASKNTTYKPDAEATNAIRATDNKEMQQTNEKKLQTEITDLEVIEKKEIPAGKQDIPVAPNLVPSQNASLAMVETKGIVGKDTAGVELPQSSTHKEVQKEWTCALCHVTTSSETILNSHLHGKKHRATCEALKAKNQPVPQKLKSKEEWKQKNIINQLNSETKEGESIVNNGLKGEKEVMNHKVQNLQKETI